MAREPLPKSPPRKSIKDRVTRKSRKPQSSGDDRRQPGSVGTGTPDTGTFWWLGGKGTVSQAYGNQSSRYASGAHDGLDIAVPVGTKVAALTDGEVVFAGDAGADGQRVGIRMDNGKTYYYGHLSSIGVKVGDRVGRGQTVAAAGSTGNSTGPHVHFELQRDGDSAGDPPIKFLERHTGGKVQGGYAGSGGAGRSTGNVGAGGTAMSGVSTTFSRKELAARYGYAAKFYDKVPGMDKFLDQAVKEQWTPEEAAARFADLPWYRQHSDAERSWTILQTSRPGEAKRQREERYNEIQQMYRELGVPLSAERLQSLVKQSLVGGWNPDEIRDAVSAEFEYKPDETFGGLAGQSIDDLTERAAAYAVPLSNATLEKWTTNILRGEATKEDFDAHLKAQAKSLFPEFAEDLDRTGMTTSDYLSSYAETAGRTLGIDPDEVDWTQPKWQGLIFGRDDKGARHLRTLAEAGKVLRTDDAFGYDSTTDAIDKAARLKQELAQTMGL